MISVRTKIAYINQKERSCTAHLLTKTFTIMKYITDKEIAENRDKFVPAPLDEKNLTTDWITDELPDYGTTAGVRCGKSRTEAVMWINGDLIRVCYRDNKISFYALETFMDADYIEKRIDELLGDTEYLVCNKVVWNDHIRFSFFWECN